MPMEVAVAPFWGGFIGCWHGAYEDARLSIKEGRKPILFIPAPGQGVIDGLGGASFGWIAAIGLQRAINWYFENGLTDSSMLVMAAAICTTMFVFFYRSSSKASNDLREKFGQLLAGKVKEVPPVAPPVDLS